ncbi:dipeptidyl aminopeptidase/acylaminoacyl peptidase [Nocardiopsis mwathae]|uniref:Dipeptidyl aminopeptidase/acylaminoacyl peptidase n=1 Tax=Nocardiopsis mwathae TaxID=1472723 RepID=A0A7W9YFP4_9ACTN|nr:dipeptidyl aminopeptidase/acylaminoacyl peptidase [Nocardiopsis mwathae]
MVRPWHELSEYVRLRRVNGLRLSPDGTRLVAPVSELQPDGRTYGTALWEIDPAGGRDPRRLTRSAAGESAPDFLPDGSLLFTSKRADPEAAPNGSADNAKPALWLLPAEGGEARRVATAAGGIASFAVARDTGTVVYAAAVHPGTQGAEADEQWRTARRDSGVTAILHESGLVRSWDSDLGPDHPRLYAAAPPDGAAARPGEARDLTPDAGKALIDQVSDITPDGGTVVTGWQVPAGRGAWRREVVAVDTATGRRRPVADDPGFDFTGPRVSPDGRYAVMARAFDGEYDGEPRDRTLWLVDLATGEGRDLLPDTELWPGEYAWAADSAAVFFTADAGGRRPVFRVDVASAVLTRVTGDDGAYSALNPAPDGAALYALRDAVDAAPAPVRLDATATDGRPTRLRSPQEPLDVPGTLTEIETRADDGTAVRAWLVLPADAADTPAPLVLWVHGGPYMSYNGWNWRWNPWLLAARGYAVLLPDPALSTGYGQDMLRRAWGRWGPRTFADLMAITDAAVARPDIDAERTAAMGGSFGGYMANWIAGHTDRFRAVVAHASLWGLDAFGGTTDYPWIWEREFGEPRTRPERYELNSPHRHVAGITTPMLVIHGDKDYRVPIGEGLRLWWDLMSHEVDAKFLYFPDENHWILTPGNARIWYETVLAFLDHHVHGKEWSRPELL